MIETIEENGSQSFSSFMSCLLSESKSKLNLSEGELKIEIVQDNAKVGKESKTMRKCVSLATMGGRSRSSRQLCRWNPNYRQDSDTSLGTMVLRQQSDSDGSLSPSQLHVKNNRRERVSSLIQSRSDTMLLKMPTRKESPRITKNSVAIKGIGSKNATWDTTDLSRSSAKPKNCNTKKIFDLLVGLDPTAPAENTAGQGEQAMLGIGSASLVSKKLSKEGKKELLKTLLAPTGQTSRHQSGNMNKPFKKNGLYCR